MANLDLRSVHVYTREPGTQNWRLVKTQPIMRLSTSGGGEVYIQHGRYWTAGGEQIKSKDLPEWVRAELAKVSPAALAEVGIHVERADS